MLHVCCSRVRPACDMCGAVAAYREHVPESNAAPEDAATRHYCSEKCSEAHFLAHSELVAAATEGAVGGAVRRSGALVKFDPRQINAERARRFVDLLADTTDEAKTTRAVALVVRWLALPPLRVAFFDAVQRDGSDAPLVARSVTINGRTVTLDVPSEAIGSVKFAATNGSIMFINRVIQTAAFQANRRVRFLRFAVPPGVSHYAAIVAHELGHAAHIADATRASLFSATWRNYVARRNGAMPSPREFDEFVEEVADHFAVGVFALL